MDSTPRKPTGVYVVCALLAWTLLGDIGRWPLALSGLRRGDGASGWFEHATLALFLVSPFVTIPSLVGLWWMRRWAPAAFLLWTGITALQTGLLLFLVGGLGGIRQTGWVFVFVVWIAALVALALLARYVCRAVRRAHAAPARC